MAPQLYVSKEDFDMLVQEVNHLKTNYTNIDKIAKRFDDLWHEQICQSAQMRRMEEDIGGIKKRLTKLEDRMDKLESRMEKIENRMDAMEKRLDKIERLLILICGKLEINPNVI